MKKLMMIAAMTMTLTSIATPQVSSVLVRQNWPWSTDIKVEFAINNITIPVNIEFKAYSGTQEISVPDSAISGGNVYGLDTDGIYAYKLNATELFGGDNLVAIPNFRLQVKAVEDAEANEVLYKIFDLSNGEVENVTKAQILNGNKGSFTTDYTTMFPDFDSSMKDVVIWTGVTNNTEYMRDKLVMRRVKAGTFLMGSPEDEFQRGTTLDQQADGQNPATLEVQHQVTLTKDYFIGVFEVTQYQYNLCTGKNSSWFTIEGDERPVDHISYDLIRGSDGAGASWPSNVTHEVKSGSFLAYLRAKFSNQYLFDLPTEAQWEHACRAGTQTANYAGENYVNNKTWYYHDPIVGKLARYQANAWLNGGNAYADRVGTKTTVDMGVTNGTARVGSYLPNRNGLYDMMGNVWEWCLDWYDGFTTDAVTDPTGPMQDDCWLSAWNWRHRVYKGGSIDERYASIRSAVRKHDYSGRLGTANGDMANLGFRLCLTVE